MFILTACISQNHTHCITQTLWYSSYPFVLTCDNRVLDDADKSNRFYKQITVLCRPFIDDIGMF